MTYLSGGMLVLLTLGSAYYLMRSLQEIRKKEEVFYREILPHMKQASFSENRGLLPSLEGLYHDLRIKIVPLGDNLCYRGLPRLYLKIYLAVDNDKLCRVVSINERAHLFPPAEFEKSRTFLGQDNPGFEICLPEEPKLEPENLNNLVNILSKIDNCSEILMQKKYIRLTLLLAHGEKGYYFVLRAMKFPALVLKDENLSRTVQLLFELRREVAKIESAC
ncbi:hypothetical protein [Phosphitispora fastidiosa]|uniref:hypothetical protein n=1 Tax=Phosphitispora fastidiosa TaxID=2837202 RepID=UPI001E2FF081|nr:hypothetical protein [Phosphitispora fastidiosa]MBU7006080.1 hypothetical protein [Phosphitispora fastidiosa]